MSEPVSQKRSLYFPTLDGLRFFAFLLVFVHHLPRAEWRPLVVLHDVGWVGVHVFLALSAYLLTAILRAEFAETGSLSVFKFYVRRALRIWPLYFAFVIVTFGYGLVRAIPGTDAFRFAGLLFFADNIVSSFKGLNSIPYAGHLWTVSLEEQFYLVLPFLLRRWVKTSGTSFKLGVLWAVFIVLRCMSVALGAQHPFIWTALFSADALVLGTALAFVPMKAFQGARHLVALVGVALLVSIVAMPPLGELGYHQVILFTVIGVGSTALVAAALNDPWLGFLSLKPLRYLGKISYGLYVFHLGGIAVGTRLSPALGDHWLAVAAVSLAATIGISIASYELFEKRLLRFKARFETVQTRPL